MNTEKDTVLVVGAGIGGTRSALDLALLGHRVILIDNAPYMGGTLIQLDRQFPNDVCGMCRMLPMAERNEADQYCLRRGISHENIETLLSTDLVAIEGEPGQFRATLHRKPIWVDQSRCIGCGACSRVCPVRIPDPFNAGLTLRKAVYKPVYGWPHGYVLDTEACTRCGECETVCPTQAIDLTGQSQTMQVDVNAVILSAGVSYHDPASGKHAVSYALPNVVSSIEFERLVSQAGPNRGKLLRPSDGRPVQRAAWFQCIGSRDHQVGADYCSCACCMYSIKEAVLAKTLSDGAAAATIFYMDMRTFGKNFQRYRDLAENEHHLRFQRSRVHSVVPADAAGGLKVQYLDDRGKMVEDVYDLIVLAVGQSASANTASLAKATGITLNPWGFFQALPFSKTRTNREGVLAGGSFGGLQDISESVIQASAAALTASSFLHDSKYRVDEIHRPQPAFSDVLWEPPRVDVVLSGCGDALSASTDLSQVIDKIEGMDDVGRVHHIQSPDFETDWQALCQTLAQSTCNRVVIGTCWPQRFFPRLQQFGEQLGLDPSLITVVDLRTAALPDNGPAGKHRQNKMVAAIAMGIGRVKAAMPPFEASIGIDNAALVVGGGIAGMTAALAAAAHGVSVHLVEKEENLGGNLQERRYTLEGHRPENLLTETIAKVHAHRGIHTHKSARVIACRGSLGRFSTTIEKKDGTVETIGHGITILATGGQEAATQSYGYGTSDRIVTQGELEQMLGSAAVIADDLSSVAMIQCVDSREEPRNYCSRVCCASALKNALFLKKANPDINVYIFFRDFMSYGFMETYYTQARRAGVIFIPYSVEAKPRMALENGRPVITGTDPVLQRTLKVEADLLVLSTGIVPGRTRKLAEIFGVNVDQDGFFQEVESKWRPTEASKRGVFVCGLAHSPRNIAETIAMAEAAAVQGLRFLSRARLRAGTAPIAVVDQTRCTGCKTCVGLCAYDAISFSEKSKSAAIDAVLCQGCGVCAAACPVASISVWDYTPEQMYAQIEGVLQ